MVRTSIVLAAPALGAGPAPAEVALIDLPFQAEFRLEEPFMDVYMRTTERLVACHANASIVDIVPLLVPEQGYAVIDAAYNLGDPDPFFRVRLQQDGSGTLVALKTTIGTDLPDYPKPALGWLEYWVRGGTTCVETSYTVPVPPL